MGLGQYAAASVRCGYDTHEMVLFMNKEELDQWAVDVEMNNGSKAKLNAAWRAVTRETSVTDKQTMQRDATPRVQAAPSPAKLFAKLRDTTEDDETYTVKEGLIAHGNDTPAHRQLDVSEYSDKAGTTSAPESSTTDGDDSGDDHDVQADVPTSLSMQLMETMVAHNLKYQAAETVVMTMAGGHIRFQCGVCGLTDAKLTEGNQQFKNYFYGHCMRGAIHKTNYEAKHGSLYQGGEQDVELQEEKGNAEWDKNWERMEGHMQCRGCGKKVMLKKTVKGKMDLRWRANCSNHTVACKQTGKTHTTSNKAGKQAAVARPSLYTQISGQLKRKATGTSPAMSTISQYYVRQAVSSITSSASSTSTALLQASSVNADPAWMEGKGSSRSTTSTPADDQTQD